MVAEGCIGIERVAADRGAEADRQPARTGQRIGRVAGGEQALVVASAGVGDHEAVDLARLVALAVDRDIAGRRPPAGRGVGKDRPGIAVLRQQPGDRGRLLAARGRQVDCRFAGVALTRVGHRDAEDFPRAVHGINKALGDPAAGWMARRRVEADVERSRAALGVAAAAIADPDPGRIAGADACPEEGMAAGRDLG